MRGVSSHGPFLAAAAALLPLFGGLAAACHTTSDSSPAPPVGEIPDYNFGDDFGIRYYFKAQGGKGVLTTDKEAPSDPAVVHSDATNALATAAGSWTGGEGRTIEFQATGPIAQDLWLNLTKPIAGVLWVTSATAPRDSYFFRTSVFLGDRYIGGDECFRGTPTATSGAPWLPTKLKMRPETDRIPAGSVLKVKVTLMGSLGEFKIGTGGSEASFLELRVTSFDLLSRAVYLESNQLRFGTVHSPTQTKESGGSEGSSGGGGLLLLLAVPALLLRGRRMRPMLAVSLLAVGALAGCVGGAADKSNASKDGPQPTVVTSGTLDPRLRGVGALQGFVASDLGLPVRGAHVVLIGTANFTNTDAKGFFKIPSVQVGTYKLRIDKEKFLPVEQQIRIDAGVVLNVNVTMVPPEDLRGNQREHIHDDWNGASTIDWWGGDATIAGYSGSGACYYYYTACSAELPIPADKAILPGTGLVEVKLTFARGTVPTDMLGLTVTTAKQGFRNGATYYYMESLFLPRKSGEPFKIYVFPDEADPGHQKFTKWSFTVWVPSTRTSYAPWDRPVEQAPSVHAEIKIHKSRVVREAPHKDFWGNLTEKQLMVDVAKTSNCAAACDFPYAGTTYYWYYADLKSLIPPGTKEIHGTFRWEHPNIPANAQTQWKLAYKPATSPYSATKADWGTLKHAPGTPSNNRLDFVIVPEAKELDPFYSTSTAWMFFPDDGQAPIYSTYAANTGYQTKWYLSLRLVKDPEFVD